MTTVAAKTISAGLEECESLEEIEFHQSKLTDDNIVVLTEGFHCSTGSVSGSLLRTFLTVDSIKVAERVQRVTAAKEHVHLSHDELSSKLGVTNTYA